MQDRLRGDEGHSFIGAVIASLVMVLISVVVFAGQAEMKKDKGGDDGKPKRVIHGKPEDRRAVEALLDESEGDAEVEMSVRGDRVKELRGKFKIDKNKPVEESALDFIDRHSNVFGLKDPKRELKKDSREGLGFQQVYNGIPIWKTSMRVHFDENYDVSLIQSNLVPTPDIDTTPLVTAEEALNIAKADLGLPQNARTWPPKTELVIYNNGYTNTLAYKVILESWLFMVDAKNGKIIDKQSMRV